MRDCSGGKVVPVRGHDRSAADPLSDRAAGWLRFLQRKTSLPGDDWSHRGRPAPAWDNISGPPTTNWYRFDAIGMAHTLLMLATVSETHRRACADILEGLCERLALHHGFNEWDEQQGPDPGRSGYPDAWRGMLIPAELWGNYDSPGWAANGTQQQGFQPNPIEAAGAIYFKGFFNYLLGVYAVVSGNDRFQTPFDIVYDDRIRFRYSHRQINEIVRRDFAAMLEGSPDGLWCEIHKLWPL